jgi:hypothetical protein
VLPKNPASRVRPSSPSIPPQGPGHQELYLMCDDIERTIGDLRQKGLECAPPKDEGWGLVTSIRLPGGDQIGLYEPRHPTALDV